MAVATPAVGSLGSVEVHRCASEPKEPLRIQFVPIFLDPVRDMPANC
jgi:hypothetical protein